MKKNPGNWFRAVGNRCAAHLGCLGLPITNEQAMTVLKNTGFTVVKKDVVGVARSRVGVSQYSRGALPRTAPEIVDCSSFVKWVYGQHGVWLPRRTIQQRELGEAVPFEQIFAGDVVFMSGRINYWDKDPSDGVGHVGIATGGGTIIHAANKKEGIVESTLTDVVSASTFRGARRYLPEDSQIVILESPEHREVEVPDDIRWIILQLL